MSIRIDLNALRKSIGLRQAELAEKIGIKQAYLSELETGKKPISTSLYNTLIEVFGEDVCDNFAISQGKSEVEQHFHGNITGSNPQFAGRDMEINPPCTFGADVDKFVTAITTQAGLTKEAHEIARKAQEQVDKAQSQIDRLLTLIESKLNN
ncbi:MAG: helix-turn-helix transcriptional regulator [Bacteroides sp.]|nr:helix-turn-helix transcriptional regulator [Bacteroides sp.]